ncbi:hypothetical protein nbrc107696_31780 [Gordonia spumicola]|uniref:Lipopolysaccharide assembly protein A domain-containing protein n=1 Tax=Gordonia spumicola TaxID=589161 RepID=A0A7I9VC09_9ACTN|nr:lipopolysaccharide assembly protein LapA domain-containing protein [Gordonia spumicola]GEE02732.1 hypothetical protein nbrc107696_31780 [Gordonia spumicola]
MSTNTNHDASTFLKQYWLPILIGVVAVVFIARNTENAQFTVFWWNIDGPLWLLLTVVTLVGFVGGWFVGRRGGR